MGRCIFPTELHVAIFIWNNKRFSPFCGRYIVESGFAWITCRTEQTIGNGEFYSGLYAWICRVC
ncbi:hypothetical protein BF17_12900 [Yersinia similis]|uniref:Uncharacterized protein n=1 Tax=Yersinia similis TaxID=367190 RepID=A0ABN4CSY0_9GAMM|nr:hypothetical protein BF17_12900 [Yersinia similis]